MRFRHIYNCIIVKRFMCIVYTVSMLQELRMSGINYEACLHCYNSTEKISEWSGHLFMEVINNADRFWLIPYQPGKLKNRGIEIDK